MQDKPSVDEIAEALRSDWVSEPLGAPAPPPVRQLSLDEAQAANPREQLQLAEFWQQVFLKTMAILFFLKTWLYIC